MKAKSSLLQSKRAGAIVVLFAILLPLMVLILGFTVDYAYIQRSRNEIRVVSDLATKAAADTLARTGGDEAAARAAARFVADQNTVAGEKITLRDDQIVFGRAYRQADGSYLYNDGQTPSNAVQVTVRRDAGSNEGSISRFFGNFYNRPTFDLVQQARANFRDVEVVLVLDRSGSMKFDLVAGQLSDAERQVRFDNPPVPTSRWMSLDSAVEVFLRELESTPVRERVGMVTFAENANRDVNGVMVSIPQVTLDSPLSRDLNLVRGNMDRLNGTLWFGGTNITSGLREARDHFRASGSSNVEKVIICLTDGVHNSGDEPFDEATQCQVEGITVHTITFSEGANQQDMLLTAENGGGGHSHAPDEATLKTIFKRLAGTFAVISQ